MARGQSTQDLTVFDTSLEAMLFGNGAAPESPKGYPRRSRQLPPKKSGVCVMPATGLSVSHASPSPPTPTPCVSADSTAPMRRPSLREV